MADTARFGGLFCAQPSASKKLVTKSWGSTCAGREKALSRTQRQATDGGRRWARYALPTKKKRTEVRGEALNARSVSRKNLAASGRHGRMPTHPAKGMSTARPCTLKITSRPPAACSRRISGWPSHGMPWSCRRRSRPWPTACSRRRHASHPSSRRRSSSPGTRLRSA